MFKLSKGCIVSRYVYLDLDHTDVTEIGFVWTLKCPLASSNKAES